MIFSGFFGAEGYLHSLFGFCDIPWKFIDLIEFLDFSWISFEICHGTSDFYVDISSGYLESFFLTNSAGSCHSGMSLILRAMFSLSFYHALLYD